MSSCGTFEARSREDEIRCAEVYRNTGRKAIEAIYVFPGFHPGRGARHAPEDRQARCGGEDQGVQAGPTDLQYPPVPLPPKSRPVCHPTPISAAWTRLCVSAGCPQMRLGTL